MKKILSKEDIIIRQNRRMDRVSAFFSVSMFLAATCIFVLLFFITEEFKGIDIAKLWAFFAKFNWLRAGFLVMLLIAALGFIALSAFFIRFLPQKKRKKIADNIISGGLCGTGEIVKMEIYRKSFYEINYKTTLKLEDGRLLFCFYSVDKSQPLPLGERWFVYYDGNFAVLDKRIPATF